MPIRAAIGRIDLPRALWLALAVVVLPLLTVISLEVYEALARSPQLERDRAVITHAFEVLAAAQRLELAAQTAGRAERGYLLTGEAGFLEIYRVQANRCPALLANLRQLAADNAEQRRQMAILASALEQWLAERQRTIDLYTQSGFAAAKEAVRSRGASDTLGTVDSLIEGSIAAERDLLIERQGRAAADERRVTEVAVLTGSIDVGLLALGVSLTVLAFNRARDVERQRLQREQHLSAELLQAEAALAQTQKMDALGQLTGGVAHDFNNLLHVIKNSLMIVQRRLRDDDVEVTRYLEMAQRNTDRAAGTTSRLLAFARRQSLDAKSTDLNDLVSGVTELLRSTLGENVSIEVILGSGLSPVAVDRNQLETAILNLAVNSRDAMSQSGKLTIETSSAFLDTLYVQVHPEVTVGQYSMIAVSDTGVGMSKEVLSRAFDPFFTTKEIGQGTGLGLSQVFGFVKQSGGHITLHSESGQGTIVKMYFPRLASSVAEKPAETLPTHGVRAAESILIVEDNEDVGSFTARILGDLGYRVTVARDGRLALEALAKLSGVDLLFTDVGLPNGLSGPELADEACRRWPRVKVLYTTGYPSNLINQYGRLDAVELITKPFTQSSLAARIRRVLDGGGTA